MIGGFGRINGGGFDWFADEDNFSSCHGVKTRGVIMEESMESEIKSFATAVVVLSGHQK